MKFTLPRRLLVSMMGVGVVSLLASAGTFAVFTASSTNINNVFAAGSLILTDTTTFTSAALSLRGGGSGSAPNLTGTDPRTLRECVTPTLAATCSTLLRSINVAAAGIEPGQYLQGTINITNTGSLPETLALQVQNVKTNNGNNSLYGAAGASGVTPCASDIGGVASPGATGAQLTSSLTAPGYAGTPVPVTGCLDVGLALRITIQDAGVAGTGPQCLFGNDVGPGPNGNDRLQAPIPGALNAGGPGVSAYVASGSLAGTGSGTCDDVTQAGILGNAGAPVLPGSNPKDRFGPQTSAPGNTTFAGLTGTNSFIFIPGASTSRSVVNLASVGGNLTSIPQWVSGETHAFTITIAFPDTGQTLITDRNNDKYFVGNDNPFQGGAVSFDLFWYATQ